MLMRLMVEHERMICKRFASRWHGMEAKRGDGRQIRAVESLYWRDPLAPFCSADTVAALADVLHPAPGFRRLKLYWSSTCTRSNSA